MSFIFGSFVSATPSLFKSSHTKLPIDIVWYKPKSTDKLVVESVSLSVVGSSYSLRLKISDITSILLFTCMPVPSSSLLILVSGSGAVSYSPIPLADILPSPEELTMLLGIPLANTK